MESLLNSKKDEFAKRLLEWHAKNKRDFSWRRTKDPFHILIAEIMLRKTDAKKVCKIYDEFIRRYPTPKALAKADAKKLKKQIHLLGIHRRAELLKSLAQDLMKEHSGIVPRNKAKLLDLPGVGEYIANAVLCFAFDYDAPLLDANIIRILNRVFALKSPKARQRTDKMMWDAAEKLIPSGQAKEFNWAILDFAALICTVQKPKCSACPIEKLCIHTQNANILLKMLLFY